MAIYLPSAANEYPSHFISLQEVRGLDEIYGSLSIDDHA